MVVFTHTAFAELRDCSIKLSVIVSGLVNITLIPENQRLDRSLMLAPEDLAVAVLKIVHAPVRACPVEIALDPQRNTEHHR